MRALASVVVLCVGLGGGVVGCMTPIAQPGCSLDVPFVSSSEGDCGVACVGMVLQYVGVATDPVALHKDVYVPALGGSTPALLAAGARQRGVQARVVYGSTEVLAVWLNQAVPPIVLLRSADAAKGHFVVVTGLGRRGSVRVHSGRKPDMWYPPKLFNELWKNARYTAVLIRNPQ
jgi:ABC-type bacteriocin/lantibiotic exporter with double-glycine peptidase domain